MFGKSSNPFMKTWKKELLQRDNGTIQLDAARAFGSRPFPAGVF